MWLSFFLHIIRLPPSALSLFVFLAWSIVSNTLGGCGLQPMMTIRLHLYPILYTFWFRMDNVEMPCKWQRKRSKRYVMLLKALYRSNDFCRLDWVCARTLAYTAVRGKDGWTFEIKLTPRICVMRIQLTEYSRARRPSERKIACKCSDDAHMSWAYTDDVVPVWKCARADCIGSHHSIPCGISVPKILFHK